MIWRCRVQNENLIGLIGGTFGMISVPTMILISWFQAKYQYRQYFMEVIEKVNERYDRLHPILNTLPERYADCSVEQKLTISRYLNLCSEEFLWWKLGLVPKIVWPTWKKGIREKLNQPAIAAAWQEHHRHEYDTGFQAFVIRLLTTI